MVSTRHAWCAERTRRAQASHSARLEAGQATPETFFRAKLQAAGFIIEVFYPEWLANPVLVMKKNKTWRMGIDYPCLNKACPKDLFALPRIDQVIDSTAGCELLSFLDATARYHQIKLAVEDQIKTAFITPFGAYCYI